MTIERVDHVAAAIARLPSQFAGLPGWEAALTALVAPLQETEDALLALLVALLIDTSTGAVLTLLGKLVKQPRNGVTDDDLYRRYVKARIATNNSEGTGEEIITISVLVLSDADARVVIDNQGIATAVVRIVDVAVTADVSDILIGFLREAAPDGVRLILETSKSAPENTFRFDVGPGFDDGHFADARD